MSCPADAAFFLWSLAAALALAAGCGGQSSSPARSQIVFNLGAEPESLDPTRITGLLEFRVLENLFNALTRLDADGIAQPALAERWETDTSHTVHTFHLRPAQWSNGDPVTAGDFVWSWRRAIDPATAADYAHQLFFLAGAEDLHAGKTKDFSTLGVKALDERTLQARLVGPTPFFPSMVCLPIYYAVHRPTVEGNEQWHLTPQTYVGNGAFRLVEWRHNDHIVADRNPRYWDAAAVKLDRVVYRMIEAETTALAAFESGTIDIVTNVPRPDIPRLRGRSDFHVAPFLGTYYVSFNCGRPPLNNPLVRKALTLAIDRKTIVEKTTLGGEEPALAWVPPGIRNAASGQSFRREKNAYFRDADVEGARQALAEAGYPGGRGFAPIRYIYNTQESHKAIAETLQQVWAATLGIQVSLENMEWKTYLARRDATDFDLARANWIADFPDPVNYLDIFLSNSGNNRSNWANPRYDELMRKSKTTTDWSLRFQLLHQAEDTLLADFALGPIYFFTDPYLEKTSVHGVMRNALGWMDFSHAWVDR